MGARLSGSAAVCLLFCAVPALAQNSTEPAGYPEGRRSLIQIKGIRDSEVVRGLWVTRWEYRSPEDVTALLSRAARFGMTDIFFQVRGRGDSFYRSNLEPWGAELTGRLGEDPGWDPLEVALREAHSRGLRLHAWINTFTMWSGTTPPPPTTPEHIFRVHPEWIMASYSGLTLRLGNRFGYVLAAPGNPQVQAHIKAVVMDIVNRYPVDGIHFDYIRLPDHNYSYDAVSRGRYLRESRDNTYMDWQTGEVTGMLGRISDAARSARPGIVLTAAIVNRYDRAVSIFAQDPASWTSSGALDYVIPMMYTPSLPEFVEMLEGYRDVLPREAIVAGINLDEMPDDPGMVAAQVHQSLLSGVRGHTLFSLDSVDRLNSRGTGHPDLYAYFEELQGVRLVTSEPADADLRRAQAPLQLEPSPEYAGEIEEATEPEQTRERPPRPRRKLWRYLLPAAAGAALVIALVVL